MPGPDPLDLPAPVLEAALARLVGDDEAGRERALAELLVQHPAHHDGLRALHDTLGKAGRLLANTFAPPAAAEPERIDGYRIVRRLGEGAFGVVYLGEQDEPIRRQVALKLLRPGAGDRGTLRRFAVERQLLATFRHPAIAGILDAGELPDGRPWFAMEYVDGTPITRYCDEQRLPLPARLSLFLAVCDAVVHAHARDVVHRDLKPANILVAKCDGSALPKVIDFGIAKALHATEGGIGADATATGRVVGTPGYMSPEQSSGNQGAVDTRTDVFALGVILYELLTGALPWPRGSTSTAEPRRPSTRLHEDTAARAAAARATEPRLLAQRLRGELDWIVLTALQHDRERRYASALAFADDLRRYLADEPVHARPPSWSYRLHKVLRRRRATIAVGSALLVAAAGLVATSLFRRDALASETQRIAAIDQAVTKLMARAFDRRLDQGPSGDEIRKEVLRDTLALQDRALQATSDAPGLRAKRVVVLNGLANLLFHNARYAESIALSRTAETEAAALLPVPDLPIDAAEQHARALRNLGRCHTMANQPDDAAAWSQQAVAAYEQLFAANPSQHGYALAGTLVEHVATRARAQDADGCLQAQRRALDVLAAYLETKPDHAEAVRDMIRFRCGLANLLTARGEYAAATAAATAALDLAERSPAATDDERGIVHRRLALLAAATGRDGEVTAHWAKAVDFTERELQKHPGRPAVHERLREAATVLAERLYEAGEDEAAARASEQAIAAGRALGPDYPDWRFLLAESITRVSWAAAGAQHFARFAALDTHLESVGELLAGQDTRAARAALTRGRIVHGLVRRDLGRPFPTEHWTAITGTTAELMPQALAFVLLEIARSQRESGDLVAAAASLARAEQTANANTMSCVAERIAQALAADDAAATVAAAERGIAADATWPMLNVAAAGLFAAARATPAENAECAVRTARAIEVLTMLLPELEVAAMLPAHLRQLFVAQSRVRLALLLPSDEASQRSLAGAVDSLDRARGNVEASWWNESLWSSARLAVPRPNR